MSLEELVDEILRLRRVDGLFVPPPASDDAVEVLALEFKAMFGVSLPAAYQRLLKRSDGLLFDGLTVWPTRKYGAFRESLIDANLDLREAIDDALLYFGQRDDVLFVFDPRDGRYAAVEMAGLAEWESFDDAEQLLTFMLERVIEPPDDDA